LTSHFELNGKVINKETYYFLANALEKSGIPDQEHDLVEWVEISEAKKLLKSNVLYEDEPLILEKFEYVL
jgi:hypothetical protein